MTTQHHQCQTCALFKPSECGDESLGVCRWALSVKGEIPVWLDFTQPIDGTEYLINCPAWVARTPPQEQAA